MRAIEFIIENKGLPFPGTYEQENNRFKSTSEDKPDIKKKKLTTFKEKT